MAVKTLTIPNMQRNFIALQKGIMCYVVYVRPQDVLYDRDAVDADSLLIYKRHKDTVGTETLLIYKEILLWYWYLSLLAVK